MTNEYYQQESQRLREVLKDAEDRGDYHLEMDVREQLVALSDQYYQEDTE